MKKEEKKETKFFLKKRSSEYLNLYVVIDGKRFELVPHTRSVKETALFYSLLNQCDIIFSD